MKLLGLGITLLLFSAGCSAFERPQAVNNAVAAVMPYVKKLDDVGKKLLDELEKTEFGKKHNLKLNEKLDDITKYAQQAAEAVAGYSEQIYADVFTDVQKLRVELKAELDDLKDKVHPYIPTVQAKIQQHIDQYKAKLIPMITQVGDKAMNNMKDLRQVVEPHAEGLRTAVITNVKDMQEHLAPLADTMKEKASNRLQNLRKNAGPMSEDVRKKVADWLSRFQKSSGQVVQDLSTKMGPYVEQIKAKAQSIYAAAAAA